MIAALACSSYTSTGSALNFGPLEVRTRIRRHTNEQFLMTSMQMSMFFFLFYPVLFVFQIHFRIFTFGPFLPYEKKSRIFLLEFRHSKSGPEFGGTRISIFR